MVVDLFQRRRLKNKGQFFYVIQQLVIESEDFLLGDIDLVSSQDLYELQCRNAHITDVKANSIAAQFLLSVESYAKAPAICSSDGDLPHGELDRASSKMAQILVSIDFGSGLIMPVCYDKSAWAVVAILGIVRAGGACAALDPTHPPPRLFSIIDDVQAKVIVIAP
jgi:non-ribosomal peptide synthetase component F